MANHHKPSTEELKAGMAASLEALDKLPPENTPATPPVETPPAATLPAETPPAPVTPPATPPEGETPPVTPPAETPPAKKEGEPATPPTPPTDWEKRYKESQREALILTSKEKALTKAQAEADALADPNDEEMKEQYPNWDELDAVTKDLAKDRILSRKKEDILKAARDQFKNVVDWEDKVTTFVNDPAVLANHPELEGKQAEFQEFATKPTHKGVEFDILLMAFKGYKASLPPVHHEGQMFETGEHRGPAPVAPKSDKITLAQAEVLRTTDYKKYVELLRAGKIEQPVV